MSLLERVTTKNTPESQAGVSDKRTKITDLLRIVEVLL